MNPAHHAHQSISGSGGRQNSQQSSQDELPPLGDVAPRTLDPTFLPQHVIAPEVIEYDRLPAHGDLLAAVRLRQHTHENSTPSPAAPVIATSNRDFTCHAPLPSHLLRSPASSQSENRHAEHGYHSHQLSHMHTRGGFVSPAHEIVAQGAQRRGAGVPEYPRRHPTVVDEHGQISSNAAGEPTSPYARSSLHEVMPSVDYGASMSSVDHDARRSGIQQRQQPLGSSMNRVASGSERNRSHDHPRGGDTRRLLQALTQQGVAHISAPDGSRSLHSAHTDTSTSSSTRSEFSDRFSSTGRSFGGGREETRRLFDSLRGATRTASASSSNASQKRAAREQTGRDSLQDHRSGRSQQRRHNIPPGGSSRPTSFTSASTTSLYASQKLVAPTGQTGAGTFRDHQSVLSQQLRHVMPPSSSSTPTDVREFHPTTSRDSRDLALMQAYTGGRYLVASAAASISEDSVTSGTSFSRAPSDFGPVQSHHVLFHTTEFTHDPQSHASAQSHHTLPHTATNPILLPTEHYDASLHHHEASPPSGSVVPAERFGSSFGGHTGSSSSSRILPAEHYERSSPGHTMTSSSGAMFPDAIDIDFSALPFSREVGRSEAEDAVGNAKDASARQLRLLDTFRQLYAQARREVETHEEGGVLPDFRKETFRSPSREALQQTLAPVVSSGPASASDPADVNQAMSEHSSMPEASLTSSHAPGHSRLSRDSRGFSQQSSAVNSGALAVDLLSKNRSDSSDTETAAMDLREHDEWSMAIEEEPDFGGATDVAPIVDLTPGQDDLVELLGVFDERAPSSPSTESDDAEAFTSSSEKLRFLGKQMNQSNSDNHLCSSVSSDSDGSKHASPLPGDQTRKYPAPIHPEAFSMDLADEHSDHSSCQPSGDGAHSGQMTSRSSRPEFREDHSQPPRPSEGTTPTVGEELNLGSAAYLHDAPSSVSSSGISIEAGHSLNASPSADDLSRASGEMTSRSSRAEFREDHSQPPRPSERDVSLTGEGRNPGVSGPRDVPLSVSSSDDRARTRTRTSGSSLPMLAGTLRPSASSTSTVVASSNRSGRSTRTTIEDATESSSGPHLHTRGPSASSSAVGVTPSRRSGGGTRIQSEDSTNSSSGGPHPRVLARVPLSPISMPHEALSGLSREDLVDVVASLQRSSSHLSQQVEEKRRRGATLDEPEHIDVASEEKAALPSRAIQSSASSVSILTTPLHSLNNEGSAGLREEMRSVRSSGGEPTPRGEPRSAFAFTDLRTHMHGEPRTSPAAPMAPPKTPPSRTKKKQRLGEKVVASAARAPAPGHTVAKATPKATPRRDRKPPPVLRRDRKPPKRVCVHCYFAKVACDYERPCGRCVRLHKTNCVDRTVLRRGKTTAKLGSAVVPFLHTSFLACFELASNSLQQTGYTPTYDVEDLRAHIKRVSDSTVRAFQNEDLAPVFAMLRKVRPKRLLAIASNFVDLSAGLDTPAGIALLRRVKKVLGYPSTMMIPKPGNNVWKRYKGLANEANDFFPSSIRDDVNMRCGLARIRVKSVDGKPMRELDYNSRLREMYGLSKQEMLNLDSVITPKFFHADDWESILVDSLKAYARPAHAQQEHPKSAAGKKVKPTYAYHPRIYRMVTRAGILVPTIMLRIQSTVRVFGEESITIVLLPIAH